MTRFFKIKRLNDKTSVLEKENAELKKENKQIVERERVVPEHYLCEMIEKNKELKAQIEKMKADVSNLVEHQGVVYANDIAVMYSKWEKAE